MLPRLFACHMLHKYAFSRYAMLLLPCYAAACFLLIDAITPYATIYAMMPLLRRRYASDAIFMACRFHLLRYFAHAAGAVAGAMLRCLMIT